MNQRDIPGKEASGEDVIDFIQYWTVILRYKKIIVGTVGVAFLLGVALASWRTPKYTAELRILPPSSGGSGMLGMISNMTGMLGGGGGGAIGGLLGGSKSTWESILKSNNVEDAIIERFKLKEVYGIKSMGETRNVLEGKLKIETGKDGIITLTFRDKNPVLAAKIANAFGEELDRVNQNLIMTSGKRSRIFLESRVKEVELKLKNSTDAVKGFQEKNKVIDIDKQSQAIFSAIAAIKARKIDTEVQLESTLAYSPASSPQANVLRIQIRDLDRQLQQLEEGSGDKANIFIPISKVPNMAEQYVWLLMDVEIQKTLLKMLVQQFEMAKIQEAQDTPTVQILDVAQVPEISDRYKKSIMIVMLSMFGSLFLSVTGALVHNSFMARKQV